MKSLPATCLLCVTVFALVVGGKYDECPACQDKKCCNRFNINGANMDKAIKLEASSSESKRLGPTSAALFQQIKGYKKAGWSARRADANQYIQVDFGKKTQVNGILLQGRGCLNQWVTEFRIWYSQDGKYFDKTEVMEGTFDRNTVVCRVFKKPIEARYFRINPTKWYRHVSLRFDFLGCTN